MCRAVGASEYRCTVEGATVDRCQCLQDENGNAQNAAMAPVGCDDRQGSLILPGETVTVNCTHYFCKSTADGFMLERQTTGIRSSSNTLVMIISTT